MRLTSLARCAGLVALLLIGNRTAIGDDRTPWTLSRIAGTPEPPPPYTVEPAFPLLRFDRPVVIGSLTKGSG